MCLVYDYFRAPFGFYKLFEWFDFTLEKMRVCVPACLQ